MAKNVQYYIGSHFELYVQDTSDILYNINNSAQCVQLYTV